MLFFAVIWGFSEILFHYACGLDCFYLFSLWFLQLSKFFIIRLLDSDLRLPRMAASSYWLARFVVQSLSLLLSDLMLFLIDSICWNVIFKLLSLSFLVSQIGVGGRANFYFCFWPFSLFCFLLFFCLSFCRQSSCVCSKNLKSLFGYSQVQVRIGSRGVLRVN
jgi:hypothetical protein